LEGKHFTKYWGRDGYLHVLGSNRIYLVLFFVRGEFMRRKDREMSREFGLEIIDKSSYGVLSMADEGNQPYGIPLSIVRSGNTLYFHCAMEGRKVDLLQKNPKVSVTFVGETQVPEIYTNEELDEIVQDEAKAAMLISKVFTTNYESAIVTGTAKVVEDEEEKIKALKLVCEKYTPTKMAYFPMAIKASLKRTKVYSIEIEELTAKAKRKK
jgi:nitroimidazol reductase NimA-like FMN-containing flavoprotein (pyridoxamine 5'-phosphate oxidase superfamily)